MTTSNQDELITDAINQLTEKLSNVLLQEFLTLPDGIQFNVILIKSAQLLLANILCQVASTQNELELIAELQEAEIKRLIFDCALIGFSDKFLIDKH